MTDKEDLYNAWEIINAQKAVIKAFQKELCAECMNDEEQCEFVECKIYKKLKELNKYTY